MAHVRQSGPDSGHGCQEKVFTTFKAVPSSLASYIYEDGPQHAIKRLHGLLSKHDSRRDHGTRTHTDVQDQGNITLKPDGVISKTGFARDLV